MKEIFYLILQIMGALSGVAVMFAGIKWCYDKLENKKLCYQIRTYQNSRNENLHIVCLWNPTNKDILEEDITEPILIECNYFRKESNNLEINIIKTTNKSLESIFEIKDRDILINFKKFPKRSGIIFSYTSPYSSNTIPGEISNKKLLTRYGSIKETPFFIIISLLKSGLLGVCMAPFLIGFKGLEDIFSAVFLSLFSLLFIILLSGIADFYFKYVGIPKALSKFFDGGYNGN